MITVASKAARQEPSLKDITLDSAPQGENPLLGHVSYRERRAANYEFDARVNSDSLVHKAFQKRAIRTETRPWRPLRGNATDSKPASRELRRRIGMPELQSSGNDG